MATLLLAQGERQKHEGKTPMYTFCYDEMRRVPSPEVGKQGSELRVGMCCCNFLCVLCGVWARELIL